MPSIYQTLLLPWTRQSASSWARRLLPGCLIFCLVSIAGGQPSTTQEYAHEFVFLYQQALQMKQQRYGERDPRFLITLLRFAAFLNATGQYERAKTEALEGLKLIGNRTILTAKTEQDIEAGFLETLGEAYRGQQQYKKAIDTYRQLLKIATRKQDINWQTKLLSKLADLEELNGNVTGAIVYQEQLIQLMSTSGREHTVEYAVALNNLAHLFELNGQLVEACQMYQKASEIVEKVAGEQHVEALRILRNAGTCWRAAGNTAKAIQQTGELCRRLRALGGPYRFELASALDTLATLLKESGQHRQAEQIVREALELCRLLYGDSHRETARQHINLAYLLAGRGESKEALQHYREALPVAQQELGEAHPLVQAIKREIARLEKEE